jgi:hypothetical protein
LDDFISEDNDEEILEIAISRISLLSHSNLFENLDISADISGWLGTEFRLPTTNETLPVQPKLYANLLAELTPRVRREWRARSRLDAVLWRHVCKAVMPNTNPGALARRQINKSIHRYGLLLAGRPDLSFNPSGGY